MTTTNSIQTALEAAYKTDRTLRIGTLEYKANRLLIGSLMRQLAEATEPEPLTKAEYFALYDVPDPEQAQRERRQAKQSTQKIAA